MFIGASLGTLSAGRVGIASMATANLIKAITVGIRYSAVNIFSQLGRIDYIKWK